MRLLPRGRIIETITPEQHLIPALIDIAPVWWIASVATWGIATFILGGMLLAWGIRVGTQSRWIMLIGKGMGVLVEMSRAWSVDILFLR